MTARVGTGHAPDGEDRLPIAGARLSARHAWRILRRRGGALTRTLLLLLLGSASALLIPPALGWIVDAVIDGTELWTLVRLTSVVVGAGLISALLMRAGGRCLVSALQGSLAELREEVFSAAVRLDRDTVERAGSADVVSRVTGDIEAITAAVSDVLPRCVSAGFTITLTGVGLALLDPWLALAALIAVPVQVWSTRCFLRRSRPLYRRLRREESERGQAVIETVSGSDTVVAHGAQAPHLARISDRSLTAVETTREATRARNRFNAGLNCAEFLGLAAVLVVGFWQVTTAGLTVGAVTAAALFFHRLFGPIGSLLSSIDDLQRAAAGLGRLAGVLLVAPQRTVRQDISDAGISVRAASHRYRGSARNALERTDLELAAGSTTVLVGVSGSGKSTLAQLVAGVLEPSTGDVHVGGVPARAAGHDGQRAVLLVTQETHVFTGTLADNLRVAGPEASDVALWSALDAVGAAWSHDLPEALETVLGPDLDDARVQQIALARVLLLDPPVVVLDEATAHGGAGGDLDAAVSAVAAGRTAVIVAHRFAQARTADEIVVMEDGRIRERGTHEALLRLDGRYARLHAAAVAP